MYTYPLRYMATTSVPLHNQQPHSVLVSSFNTYFPHVWLSLDAIVSPVGQTTSQLHGNILDYCMFESTPTFVSLANLLFPEVAVSICSMTQLLSRLQHESISATNRNYYYQKSPLEDARSTLAASSYDGVEPLISAPSCDGAELLLSASSCDGVEPLLSASSCDGVDPLMFASYCGGVKPLLFVPYCDSVEPLPSALYCDSVGFNLCDISCDNSLTSRSLFEIENNSIIGINFTFQSFLYSDFLVWMTSCIFIINTLRTSSSLQCFVIVVSQAA